MDWGAGGYIVLCLLFQDSPMLNLVREIHCKKLSAMIVL